MPPAPRAEPQASYKQAVVLYYWKRCGYCKQFAPIFQDVVARLPNYVKVYQIEVAEQRPRLEQLHVNTSIGVPRVELYDAQGRAREYTGPRQVQPLLQTIQEHVMGNNGLSGGGGGAGAGAGARDVDDDEDGRYSAELLYLLQLLRQKRELRQDQGDEEEDEESEGEVDISDLVVNPSKIRAPAMVLYYRDSCPYCVKFKPVYRQLADREPGFTVCAVDTAAHPTAMKALQPSAQSSGVPHVVMFSPTGGQLPFTQERTVENLMSFAQAALSGDTDTAYAEESEGEEEETESQDSVSVSGGAAAKVSGGAAAGTGRRRQLQFAEKPKKTSMRQALSDALDELQDAAEAELGANNRELFEKKHSSVCYVAWLRSETKGGKQQPANDRMYCLLIPRQRRMSASAAAAAAAASSAAEFPVFAVIFGKRKGPLSVRIFTRSDPMALIKQKQRAGYQKAAQTDVIAQAMRDMGYTVRIDSGGDVIHI
jgi:thiol-disulfide isomerase/thioredoxin